MNNISVVEDSCVGCRNCEVICPTNAISFEHNKEGFLFPVINDSKCFNCSKCIAKCPTFVQKKDYYVCQNSYVAISRDKKIYKTSASGGIFSSVALYYLDNFERVAIVGAAYEKKNSLVKHIMIENIDDLFKLQGSKYVQSDLDSVVEKIEDKLLRDYYIVFSGTPCQVLAIRKMIPDNLQKKIFFIDLVCHGIPSPTFLQKDLEWRRKGKNIDNITFRKKSKYCNSKSEFFLTIQSGKYKTVNSYKSDVFYNMFMKGMTFRESCYTCKFAQVDRVGDITIGDCDSAHLYKEFYPQSATSLLMINTDKGRNIISNMNAYIDKHEINLEEEAKFNCQLRQPFARPQERDRIYDIITTENIENLTIKYARKKTITEKIGIAVFDYIPRKWIKKALGILNRKGYIENE